MRKQARLRLEPVGLDKIGVSAHRGELENLIVTLVQPRRFNVV
jgi:hypothetical protein